MTNYLVKKFIKNNKDIDNSTVRADYGMLAAIVGIIINVFLFGIKMFGGIITGSLSVKADAANSLSDAMSQAIALFGIKLSKRPADKEHPFGHGRYEYITSLVVGFIILQVGSEFIKSSLQRIKNPVPIEFKWAAFACLLASVLFKLWLCFFNKKLGNLINSGVMKATAADALGDVMCTSVVAIGMVLDGKFGIKIDGYAGFLVAILVILAGCGVIKDTLEPLIGAAADPELAEKIKEKVLSYDGIEGTHDLIVHSYGPTKHMATIHAEVSNKQDIEDIHELIDRIELEVRDELNVFLVIHMDPIELENKKVIRYKKQVSEMLDRIDKDITFHDFRVVFGQERINVIFDIVVPTSYSKKKQEEIKKDAILAIKAMDSRANPIIFVEHSYVAEK